jgi:hypothetical protein
MPLEHKLPRTVSPKGVKKVRQVTSGNKTQITVLACGNAIGQAIPPMVIFSGKRFNHELSVGEVPGTLYGMSDSGWMDMELFYQWFSDHFLKHASPCRPLLLLLDGHSSHFTLDLIKKAREQGVVIFCLPPHTTADSQPLDTAVFGPLKTHWNNACRQYMFEHPGRVISKFQFSTLFSQAWPKGMSIDNIISGTGVFPFNPNALLDKVRNSTTPEGTLSGKDHVPPATPINSPPTTPTAGVAGTATSDNYSSEKLELYRRRFKNGYDIYTNQKYVAWLRQYHPDSAPSSSALDPSVDATGM